MITLKGSGILAGAATTVALCLTFGLLGLTLGVLHTPQAGLLGTIRPWAGAWLAGAGAVSFYAGGRVCGRLNGAFAASGTSASLGAAAWAAAIVGLALLTPVLALGLGGSAIRMGLPSFAWVGFLVAAAGLLASIAGARGASLTPPDVARRDRLGESEPSAARRHGAAALR